MTSSQLAAIGRHLVTIAATVVTTLAALHLVNAGDAAAISNAINQISTSVSAIAVAVAPLVGIASTWYAAYKANHQQQIKSVNAIDGVKVVSDLSPSRVVTEAPKPVGKTT